MQNKNCNTEIIMIGVKNILLFCIIIFLTSSNIYSQIIVAGGRHSLIICEDQTVQSWGYNGYGQLGTGNLTEQHSGHGVM